MPRSTAWREFKTASSRWHFSVGQLTLLALGEMLDRYQGHDEVLGRILVELRELPCEVYGCQCRKKRGARAGTPTPLTPYR